MTNNLRNRKRRNIRRGLVIIMLAAVIIGVILYNQLRPDDQISVRTARLEIGDISSYYYVTAEIKPGSVTEHAADVSQMVLEVLVEPQQQVQAGDILAILDQQELEDQYEAAREARRDIEASLAEADEAQQARLDAAEQARRDLEHEISRLSSSLSSAASQLTRLAAIEPASLEVAPDLEERIAQVIVNAEPETVEQDIEKLLTEFRQAASIVENPEYNAALSQLEQDLQRATGAAGNVLSGLASTTLGGSIALPDDLAEQFGAFAELSAIIQDPLAQAIAQEEAARSQLERSRPNIYAESSGIVAQINISPGEYTGAAQIASQTGLESILGGVGSINSLTQQTASAFTIYDNTSPQAVFLVGRFDAGRIEAGMPARYDYEGQTFHGEIISKGKIAVNSSSNQLEGLGILGDVGGGFSSEPQLEVRMDIRGSNLTELVTGFWIEAEIEVARAENVLLIPAEAMRRELDMYYVFLINEQGTVTRQPFTPGIQSELFVEVKEGLNEGAQVVLSPPTSLAQGQTVRVMPHG